MNWSRHVMGWGGLELLKLYSASTNYYYCSLSLSSLSYKLKRTIMFYDCVHGNKFAITKVDNQSSPFSLSNLILLAYYANDEWSPPILLSKYIIMCRSRLWWQSQFSVAHYFMDPNIYRSHSWNRCFNIIYYCRTWLNKPKNFYVGNCS